MAAINTNANSNYEHNPYEIVYICSVSIEL